MHVFLKISSLFLHLRDFHKGKKRQKSWIIRWLWQRRWFLTPYNVPVTFLKASWEVTSRQVNGYLLPREVRSRQNRVQPKTFRFIIHQFKWYLLWFTAHKIHPRIYFTFIFHFPKEISSFEDSRWTIAKLMAILRTTTFPPIQRNNFTEVKMDLTVTSLQRHAGRPTILSIFQHRMGIAFRLSRKHWKSAEESISRWGYKRSISLILCNQALPKTLNRCKLAPGLSLSLHKEFLSAQIFRNYFTVFWDRTSLTIKE